MSGPGTGRMPARAVRRQVLRRGTKHRSAITVPAPNYSVAVGTCLGLRKLQAGSPLRASEIRDRSATRFGRQCRANPACRAGETCYATERAIRAAVGRRLKEPSGRHAAVRPRHRPCNSARVKERSALAARRSSAPPSRARPNGSSGSSTALSSGALPSESVAPNRRIVQRSNRLLTRAGSKFSIRSVMISVRLGRCRNPRPRSAACPARRIG